MAIFSLPHKNSIQSPKVVHGRAEYFDKRKLEIEIASVASLGA